MKYFMIEGTLNNSDNINDNIMNEHMAYTQKAMDSGKIYPIKLLTLYLFLEYSSVSKIALIKFSSVTSYGVQYHSVTPFIL